MWLKNNYFIILFNAIFSILGIIVITFGILYKLDFENVAEKLENSNFTRNADILVAIGVLVFIIAIFGCYGGFKKDIFILSTYGGILMILAALQSTAAILSISNATDKFMTQSSLDLQSEFDKKSEESKEYFNSLQDIVKCCGVNSAMDYGITSLLKLPDSCCRDKDSFCSFFTAYKTGCASKIIGYVDDNAAKIGYIAISLCLVQVLGAALSFITIAFS